ncbi:MAG TPA: DUF971 domain-containing protein [Candidatus Limnocylindrales bacterium]
MSDPRPAGDPTVPLRIHADRDGGRVSVDWADGHHTEYDLVSLRWLCPCAFCRGEGGQPGWLDTRPTLSADQTRLVDVAMVGRYAIEPVWGDGHKQGFYSFETLREHCPCEACERRRWSTPAPA